MKAEELLERTAQIAAHRACIGLEHDPQNGKLHGCCVVCGVPWPCDYAGKPPESQRTAELRAMRFLLDWRKRRALLLVTEGASSGEAALCAIGELERMTNAQLEELLEEADK